MNPKIYLGTWCHEQENTIRLFFVWYFRQSTRDPKNYPRELTQDEWFEQLKSFHKNILPNLPKKQD